MTQPNANSEPAPSPWGAWATVGFGLGVFAVFLLIQAVVGAAFVAVEIAKDPNADLDAIAQTLEVNGLLLATATLATGLVCTGIIVLIVALRRGHSVRSYLCLNPVGAKELTSWLAVCTLFIIASDTLTQLLGRSIVPEFMFTAYETAGFLPVLWLALIFAAPLFEELFFRGFLLEGFRASRLGPPGAVLLTSAIWASIHLQYGAYEIATIFAMGILFAIARLQSSSLYTPLAMHAIVNLVATVQTAILSKG